MLTDYRTGSVSVVDSTYDKSRTFGDDVQTKTYTTSTDDDDVSLKLSRK